VDRKLVGFEVLDRGIARPGYPIFLEEGADPVGRVTSGTQLPTFGKAMGMAYVPPAASEAGTDIMIGIRNRTVPARVVGLPFYSRKKGS
jgi:aminomethyltransferase